MSSKLHIKKNSNLGHSQVSLPASKSESNRLLIIDALSGFRSKIQNLSKARDTQTMIRLLNDDSKIMDVIDAGTTMRFLTSYFAISNKNKQLTGTPRMKERPIKILADALQEIGALIKYTENIGYPPIETCGFEKQLTNSIKIRGDVSSQFISAILLVAPHLPHGLTIELTGKIGSRPYIELTTALMKKFGAHVEFPSSNSITIEPLEYTPGQYYVESDWSGASYWYAFVSLSKNSSCNLKGLRADSFQGDRKISEFMKYFGVKTIYQDGGVLIEKTDEKDLSLIDLSDNPDLAQTLAVVSAVKGKEIVMTGLESLRIKETDRIAALQTELNKIGSDLEEIKPGHWKVQRATDNFKQEDSLEIETYDDHRMAMAFAPLALMTDLTITNPDVVNKSFPNFWDEMSNAGFQLKQIK
jgi:3-phosphoshikimate 1-carboxyvinyltransferase